MWQPGHSYSSFTIAITVVAHTLVFVTVCIASFFLERFRALSDVDKFTWCAKGTKLFYFPIPIFTGLWYLLVDDTLKKDVVNGPTKTAFVVIYVRTHWFQSPRQRTDQMAVGKLLYGNQFSSYSVIHSSLNFCYLQSIQCWYILQWGGTILIHAWVHRRDGWTTFLYQLDTG